MDNVLRITAGQTMSVPANVSLVEYEEFQAIHYKGKYYIPEICWHELVPLPDGGVKIEGPVIEPDCLAPHSIDSHMTLTAETDY